MSECGPVLNDAQLEVAYAPVDARLLVIAGAGQGKTEVVASRIGSLVEEEDLSAMEEVLVLSFSRAAVSAVKNRLHFREVPAPNVRTFDSFASALLLDADIEPKGSFGARIRRATRLLEGTGDDAPEPVARLRHVIIDEIQDLVGDRADFVLTLLSKLDVDTGITALGDPLQSVYDFTLEESYSQTTSVDVFEALQGEFECETVGLGENYRARGADPKRIVELGEELRELEDGDDAELLLEEFVAGMPNLGHIGRWYEHLLEGGKTTAVLCATNADALRVSRWLRWKKVPHVIRRHAQDFGPAKWIAQALGSLPGPKERRSEVEAALERLLDGERAKERWNELKAAEGNGQQYDALDLKRIHRCLGGWATPLPLTESDHSKVIVSTIHRAKGLEFDRVFIVEPTWPPDDEDPWTGVCRDYVALSRARDEVIICEYGRPKASIREERGRFVRKKKNFKTKRTWTESIEFQYSDVETDVPASSGADDVHRVQTILASNDLIGAAVHLQVDEKAVSAHAPSYLLMTDDGRLVGRTSARFNSDFVAFFGCRKGYPKIVNGLTLASVETVAGDPRQSERAGLGSAGFWLVPRVTGLASPDWSVLLER
ncbi:MAG: UvrD-helicase domain-containing protein [Mycolicibacter algericus]|uniref:UvrD-helicase domain-containing protein n=1 Tax=Mycolicibacter algericus TaxID=1288388 RepID=UPI003C748C4D